MPKLFCISDVHGFYDEMRKALDDAGFDPNNENHWLISCGDNTDRGRQPKEVINYLMSLPRKILIKGNHCDLLMDCINRGYGEHHDCSNGTVQTILDLAPNAQPFNVACAVAYEKIKDFIGSMVNYFETKNYIFVHAFIPLVNKDGLPPYYLKNRHFEFNPDWRTANDMDWDDARWGNPYQLLEDFHPDKTLVFGHWHTSYARAKYNGEPEWGSDADFSPYYGEGYIGIDACTAYSHKVNCLVLEDELIDGQS